MNLKLKIKKVSTLFFYFAIIFNIAACLAEEPTKFTRKEIIVGTSSDFPPFSFLENNEIVGLDIDIIKEVAKRLGYGIKIIDTPFKTLLPAIQMGKIDVLAAGVTDTEARAKQMLFATKHLTEDPFVIVTEKKNIITQGVNDLTGKIVIVNDGYTAAEYMSKIEAVKLLHLKAPSDAIAALKAKKAFAFVTAKSTVMNFFKNKENSEEFTQFVLQNTGETANIAITKKEPGLHKEISNTINAMLQDGAVEQIKKKWGL